MRYSPSVNGFYPESIDYPELPSDVLTIAEELYRALLAAQGEGQMIQAGTGGMPIAVTPPVVVTVPASVPKVALVRAMREVALDGTPATGASAWDAVKAAMAAAPGNVLEDWELSTVMPRDDPSLNLLAGMMDVSTATLDAVFIRAREIDAG